MDNTVIAFGQSLFDIAIQQYGTPNAALAIAFENGLSITDELEPGQLLALPFYDAAKIDVAAYYSKKSILPSTGLTDENDDVFENNDDCNLCKCFT